MVEAASLPADDGREPLDPSRILSPAAVNYVQLLASVEDYAIFTLDLEGRIMDWNLGAHKIKSYMPEEIIGQHFSIFYSQEDRDRKLPEMELEIVLEKGRFTDEGWRLRKDGSRFWASVTITAIPADDGSICGFLKITRDLTDRMLATEELRQTEERFRLLLESVWDHAIFMLDAEGHIISWNEGARRLKGYEEHEVLGKHFSLFYPPVTRAEQTAALLRLVLKDGRAESEGWRLRKDGSKFWGQVSMTAVHDAKGELRGFAKVTRDLTERRNVQRLEEANQRKNAFLATLAHELRNPLAPILVGVDVILRSADDLGAVRRVAPMLHRQVTQMAHLIDDLLDMSRVETGKATLVKSQFTLDSVLESAIETIMPGLEERGHEFVVRKPQQEIILEADHSRISQVISNLLSNAVKYTPPGGRIVLDVSTASADTLRVSVSDNGIGIAPAMQDRVFELFEQASSGSGGGLGIGLTLVKALVEMHGGTVGVTSAGVGGGSEFRVVLPVVASYGQPTGAKETSHVEPGKSAPLRVLVADDGKNAADILAMFWQLEGMETAVAYDGLQAVEIAETFKPDFIFMDLGMPNMDGYEAARRIRMFSRGVVIVALSGWGEDEDRKRSAYSGFDDHLVKPTNPEILREVMAKFRAKS
ncbi:MAG: PAS domain S-box protein [Verrucomicrobiota bacterium]